MRKPISRWLGIVSLAGAVALWAGPAAAGGGISGSLGIAPIGSGDAGQGVGAPRYDDAFDTGGIIRIEPFYDFTPFIRGQVGLAGAKWDGQSFGGEKFDDLKMTALYAGVKVRFLAGRPIRPYAVADLGFAHYNAVSLHNNAGVSAPYWGKTDTGYFDIGGGCEFIVTPNLSFFADLRIMATGSPDSVGIDSGADGVSSVPLTAGVNFTF